MKLINIYNNLLNEQSDCSNLFTDSSDGSLHITAINNDLYYYVIKLIKVTVEYMSPDEFFDELGGFEEHSEIIDWDDVNKKVESMKNGIKLPIPYLVYSYGFASSHEGRHRSLAAKKMGCTSIPVMVQIPVNESDIMKLANKLGHLKEDEIIVELKKMGFKHFQNIGHVTAVLKLSKDKGEYYGR